MNRPLEVMKTIRDPHRLVLGSFKWGKYVIIYGSIFFLTFFGILIWIFGTFNFFYLLVELIEKWRLFHENFASVMQLMEANVVFLLDIYLLSVVLFIVAIGLYAIFIKSSEGGVRLPKLLGDITNISQLERYLFGTIVAMLLVAALNKILYPEEIALIENAVTVGMICAVVLVISIYLAVQHSGER